jgi:hypothetical protein
MSGKRGRTVTLAEFRRLWLDTRLSTTEIGAMLGITQQAVCLRARKRGLPPRGFPVERLTVWHDPDLLRRMWTAGVLGADICAHFGAAPDTLRHAVKRFGLPRRGPGRFRTIRIAEFWQVELAERMRAEAARVQKACFWRKSA